VDNCAWMLEHDADPSEVALELRCLADDLRRPEPAAP
jgi:hypothetical protein